jgi:hypothetical protein
MRDLQLTVLAAIACFASAAATTAAATQAWSADKVWHDGLVEKAVYTASRVVYDKPRAYEAVFFTNKEQHDRKTLTKADKSTDTVEVWKFNQVEVIPTPNYDYKYVTTAHLTVDGVALTRLDCSSQEFCGTSFKQYFRRPGERKIDYWSFSYMPEAGRQSATYGDSDRDLVAQDSLPLFLRGYNFARRGTRLIGLLPSQKSNRPTDSTPLNALIRFVGEEGETYKLELVHESGQPGGTVLGTYWISKDPSKRHVMMKYRGADGQQYDLKSVERVNYWSIKE